MLNQQLIGQARSEAFAEYMLGVLNHAALSLMISIGQKTRLFDLLTQLPHRPVSGSHAPRACRSATCASGWLRW